MATPSTESGPAALELRECPGCGLLHPKKPTLTPAEVAYLTAFALSSIYTYHSRGGILPKTVRNGRGNPRWSACAIAKWLHGVLPEDELQPVREARVVAR